MGLLAVLAVAPISSRAVLFPQYMNDHTLCCRAPGADLEVTTAPETVAPAGGGAAAAKDAPEVENGYLKLGFDRLASYKFVPPPFDPAADPNAKPPTGEEQIPEAVKSWNDRKAIVTGFMLPVKMDGGLVTEFLLVSDPMLCCYGAVPDMNQWIVVKMNNGGVRPLMDVPISFYGKLKVGAMFENGYMTGIYLLEGEKMGEVQG